jgi:membrane-associated phospholipid phosphatase
MARRRAAVFLLVSLVAMGARAQSSHDLDLWTDLGLGIGALGLFTTSQLLEPQIGAQEPLDEINVLDRAVVRPFSTGLDAIGTCAAYATLVLPAIAVLGLDTHDRFLVYPIMYGEAFLLTYGMKDLLKALVSRHRPYSYAGAVPPEESDDYYNSFPSGHTAFSFLGATFLTCTFARDHPESRWRTPLAISSYALAAGVAVTRVLSGSHFITDVMVGAAIGTLFGWAVPALHRH